MPVLRQSRCISKAGLSRERHVLTKCKDYVPDVPGFNQNIEARLSQN